MSFSSLLLLAVMLGWLGSSGLISDAAVVVFVVSISGRESTDSGASVLVGECD